MRQDALLRRRLPLPTCRAIIRTYMRQRPRRLFELGFATFYCLTAVFPKSYMLRIIMICRVSGLPQSRRLLYAHSHCRLRRAMTGRRQILACLCLLFEQ